MAILRQHARWFGLATVATIASAILVFAPAIAAPPQPAVPSIPIQGDGPRQLFREDLTVEGGQTIEGDVFVYDGDVHINGGGRITGNLAVFSGDIRIDGGGSVGGDATAYSGDVNVSGSVDGNLSCLSGDISLKSSARVGGDVSALSGDIERAEGAYVGGNIVEGPSFRIPTVPNTPHFDFQAPSRSNPLAGILGFILRLIGAVVITGVVALITGVVVYAQPNLITRTRATLFEQTALSFVIGLFGNLTLLFLAGILAVTVCLLPIALVPMLALIAVNVVGWTVASQLVGERVVQGLKQSVQPALTVAVGAVLLTGIATLFWAFGGCFRLLGFLFTLGVASFGTGAVIVPYINRRPGGSAPTAGGDVTTTALAVVPQPVATSPAEPTPVETDIAAPVDYVTAEEVNLEQTQGDDFTRIRGVGPAFARRLKDAGVNTFAALAALSPEQVAEIIGWPAERVVRTELIEQAAQLAQES